MPAPTNKAFGFDIILAAAGALIPSGGTQSTGFSVPINISAMTLLTPAALDATTTIKLQMLSPANPDGNPNWVDAYYWDPGAAAGSQAKQLLTAAVPTNQAIVFGGTVLPGGFMRLVASTAQAADRQFYVLFSQTQR
jgi:hypothetical protein